MWPAAVSHRDDDDDFAGRRRIMQAKLHGVKMRADQHRVFVVQGHINAGAGPAYLLR